mgnify:CR=1 FL=1
MIAWAWKEYVDDPSHNPEWLPRLPMVKAAFQCMRATQEWTRQQKLADIQGGIGAFEAFAKRSDRGLSKELGSDYPNGYKYLEGKRLRRRDDFLTALLRSMSFHGLDL